MTHRNWVKLWCREWIEGTLRDEKPEVRGVWADLLALSGSSQHGDIGAIKLANGVGYTDNQMAEILHISKALWRRSKERFIESQRIKIAPKGAITIINWSKYQSEYQRQKPYRQKAIEENPEMEEHIYYDKQGKEHTKLVPKAPYRMPKSDEFES